MSPRPPAPRPPFPAVAGRVSRPVDRASDWEAMYRAGEDRWDIGGPSPPLVAALGRGEVRPPGRALVPGCGRGHDVRLLAERGFDALGVDFAPRAVAGARALARAVGARGARFERRDLFRLPRTFDGAFDLVFEQTSFCAVHPDRRDAWARAMHRALRPGGLLLALFLVHPYEEGPPFGTSRAEVRHRFVASGLFRLEAARVPAESTPARQGKEWMAFLRRPPA
ncbi:MAG: TPMT family class I SAM-dependent methyltransferase [Planctomycetes bacterium]|nr:TPMT family class I SAM-dependent methyltransferase [Planctomycetota bacterium]